MVDDQAQGKTPTVIADHVGITYRVFGVRGDRHPETEDQSAFGRLVRMRPAQPDERRVGVAVDHHMALGLYQFPRAAHDLVATQSDRRCPL